MSQVGRFFNAVFPPATVVEDLTGNTGGPVPPDGANNINVVGDGTTVTVAGNPGTSTLTISAMGSVAITFDADSGTANPALGIISLLGGTNMNTSASGHTVLFNLDNAINVATSITTPLYIAPTSSTIVMKMADSIGSFGLQLQNSLGSGVVFIDSVGNASFNSVTTQNITLLGNTISSNNTNGAIILSPNGSGVVEISYATANSVPYFGTSGSIISSAALTNGQILIGNTGNPPQLGTITAGTGITVTNGAGSITIAASGTTTISYTPVNHAASPYTVLATDNFIGCDSTLGAISILLPNAPATGRTFTIKDTTAQAAANNITVTTVGGAVTIDGSTSFVMNTNYESINVLFNGTSYLVY